MPPHWRTYQLMRIFPGLTPQTIAETPAVTWDWLLKIHEVVGEYERRAASERPVPGDPS